MPSFGEAVNEFNERLKCFQIPFDEMITDFVANCSTAGWSEEDRQRLEPNLRQFVDGYRRIWRDELANSRYQVTRILDTQGKSSGCGELLIAKDHSLRRDVVLKRPKATKLTQEETVSFLQEPQLAAKLAHPNIIQVFDVGHGAFRLPDAVKEAGSDQAASAIKKPFYAMRRLEGKTLEEAIGDLDVAGRTRHFRSVRELSLLRHFVTVCSAVAFCHKHRECLAEDRSDYPAYCIVHVDLKPANVLLENGDAPVVLDFGAAQRVYLDSSGNQATLPKPSQSTPQYRPQETYVSKAWDIYSLGRILERIVSAPPATTDSGTTKEAVTAKPRRSKTPKALASICKKATQVNPKDRYQSVEELRDEVERWIRFEKVIAHRERFLIGAASRFIQRKPQVVAGVVAFLLVLAGSAGILGWQQYAHARRLDKAQAANDRVLNSVVDQFTALRDYPSMGDGIQQIVDTIVSEKDLSSSSKAGYLSIYAGIADVFAPDKAIDIRNQVASLLKEGGDLEGAAQVQLASSRFANQMIDHFAKSGDPRTALAMINILESSVEGGRISPEELLLLKVAEARSLCRSDQAAGALGVFRAEIESAKAGTTPISSSPVETFAKAALLSELSVALSERGEAVASRKVIQEAIRVADALPNQTFQTNAGTPLDIVDLKRGLQVRLAQVHVWTGDFAAALDVRRSLCGEKSVMEMLNNGQVDLVKDLAESLELVGEFKSASERWQALRRLAEGAQDPGAEHLAAMRLFELAIAMGVDKSIESAVNDLKKFSSPDFPASTRFQVMICGAKAQLLTGAPKGEVSASILDAFEQLDLDAAMLEGAEFNFYVEMLMEAGKHDDAERLLRSRLAFRWTAKAAWNWRQDESRFLLAKLLTTQQNFDEAILLSMRAASDRLLNYHQISATHRKRADVIIDFPALVFEGQGRHEDANEWRELVKRRLKSLAANATSLK